MAEEAVGADIVQGAQGIKAALLVKRLGWASVEVVGGEEEGSGEDEQEQAELVQVLGEGLAGQFTEEGGDSDTDHDGAREELAPLVVGVVFLVDLRHEWDGA